MRTTSSGGGLSRKLGEMADAVAKAQEVHIGFLEDAHYPDGTSVAMVAAINEYGRPPSQPPRPFFRQMINQHSNEWGTQVGQVLKARDYNARATLSDMGELIKGELQTSITEFTDPPLKPATIAAKGFPKPLIDTGTMLRSVDYIVVDKNS